MSDKRLSSGQLHFLLMMGFVTKCGIILNYYLVNLFSSFCHLKAKVKGKRTARNVPGTCVVLLRFTGKLTNPVKLTVGIKGL